MSIFLDKKAEIDNAVENFKKSISELERLGFKIDFSINGDVAIANAHKMFNDYLDETSSQILQ